MHIFPNPVAYMHTHMHMHNTYIYTHTYIQYVLLKALPPVCMKYTARDESRVANIARGEPEYYISHNILIKSFILSYKRRGSVSSVLLHFTLTKVSSKCSSLVILTHSLNKKAISSSKMCQ